MTTVFEASYTELKQKEAENERLKMMLVHVQKAAMPFAEHDWYDAELEDDNCPLTKHSGNVTVGHWRALRAALASTLTLTTARNP